MQKIIVDGYNVIHADPALRRSSTSEMRRARVELIERIREYLDEKDVQVTVVFDGAGVIVDTEPVIPGRLQVVYSASGQSADEFIVTTLNAYANPREYIVVTSDMADIGRSVRAMGAHVMSSSRFLERLAGGGADGVVRDNANEHGTPGDVDYWLEKFERREEDDQKRE